MLAWEMGVGKTAPMLRAWENTASYGPLLVMCLASARENWAREARKFAIDKDWPPHVQIIRNAADPLNPAADVVICNYDKLLSKEVIKRLRAYTGGALILDAAHALKTSDATRTQLVYGGGKARGAHKQTPLKDRAARVWLGTGTPMPNHPGELYSHAAALWPELMQYNGHLMEEWEFQAAFCEIKQTKYGMQVVGGRNLAELRDRLLPVVNVLKRRDVLNLPPCQILSWPLDAETTSGIGKVPNLPDLLGTLGSRYGTPDCIDNFDVATLDAYLACMAAEFSHLATIRRETSVLKAICVGLMVKEELDCGAPKTVVFAYHREAISTLAKILASHKPAVIHGGVAATERQAEIDRFQDDPACRTFIGQLTAAGTSINLQAGKNVVFVEADWCPGVNEQALSRVYRKGQNDPVLVRFAYLGGSIDEAVIRAIARKTAMISQII